MTLPVDLIHNVRLFVESYMSQFDPSHDYEHVCRVYKLAMGLYEKESVKNPKLSKDVIELTSLMHDIAST